MGDSSQWCLQAMVDLRSDETSASWDISSFDEGGHTYQLTEKTPVTVTQPWEPAFIVPFLWEFDVMPKMELYSPGVYVDEMLSREQTTSEQTRALFDEIVAKTAARDFKMLASLFAFNWSHYMLNRSYDTTNQEPSKKWQVCAIPYNSRCANNNPARLMTYQTVPAALHQFDPSPLTKFNGTYWSSFYSSDYPCLVPWSSKPFYINCSANQQRNFKVPFLSSLSHFRHSDDQDKMHLFVTQGVRLASNISASVGGSFVRLLNQHKASSTANVVVSVDSLYSDSDFWGNFRPFLYHGLENEAKDPSKWRFISKASGTACGDPDTLVIRHISQGAGPGNGTCGLNFGSCVNFTYYDLYRDQTKSLKMLPNLARLTGSMTTATQSHFSFDSSARFHVQYTSQRAVTIDPSPSETYHPGAPGNFSLFEPPCGPDGDCGWDPLTSSLMPGYSRFVMVPEYNTITIEFPIPGNIKEPKICNLSATWAPSSTYDPSGRSVFGSLTIHFVNCGNLDGSFAASVTCTNLVSVRNVGLVPIVAFGASSSVNATIDLVLPFTPGTVAECNSTIFSVETKPLWSSEGKSMSTITPLPIFTKGFVPCDPLSHCSGHGVCDTSGQCNCTLPFQGSDCAKCPEHMYGSACEVFCDPNVTCSSRGSCHAALGLCVCEAPWTGRNCTVNACASSPVHPERTLSAYNFYEPRTCPANAVLRCRDFPHMLSHCSTKVCSCYCLLPGHPSTNPCNLTLGYNPYA